MEEAAIRQYRCKGNWVVREVNCSVLVVREHAVVSRNALDSGARLILANAALFREGGPAPPTTEPQLIVAPRDVGARVILPSCANYMTTTS